MSMKLTKADLKNIVKECLMEMLKEPEVAAVLMESLNKPTVQNPMLGRAAAIAGNRNGIMGAILEDTANTTLQQQMGAFDPEQFQQGFVSPQQVFGPPTQQPLPPPPQVMYQQPQYQQPVMPQLPQRMYGGYQPQTQMPQRSAEQQYASNWARLAFNQPIKLGGADHGTGGAALGSDPNFLPGRNLGQF